MTNHSQGKRKRTVWEIDSDVETDDQENITLPKERITPPDFSGPTTEVTVDSKITFLVSESVLQLNSIFATTLSSRLRPSLDDGLRNQATDQTLRLPNDSVFAMRIVFLILHHRILDLPATLSFDELAELATVCDKYECGAAVSPHSSEQCWIEEHWDSKKRRPKNNSCDWTMWPLIILTLDGPDVSTKFYDLLDILAGNMIAKEGQLVVQTSDKNCPLYIEGIPEVTSASLKERRCSIWTGFKNDWTGKLKELASKRDQSMLHLSMMGFMYQTRL